MKSQEEKEADYQKIAKERARLINQAFSNPVKQEEIDMAVRMGMIPVSELKNNQWYLGDSRNANKGRWDVIRQAFFHYRYKFGWMEDYVDCVNTETRYAMFVPMLETTEETKHLEEK